MVTTTAHIKVLLKQQITRTTQRYRHLHTYNKNTIKETNIYCTAAGIDCEHRYATNRMGRVHHKLNSLSTNIEI